MRYLVKLKPLDKFFFGGEKTLGGDNELYFVKSLYFPQQTTILGVIRREILLQNGMAFQNAGYDKIKDHARACRAIGPRSFNINSPGEQDFGWIKKLSPLFLSRGGDHYITAPRGYPEGLETKEQGRTLTTEGSIKSFVPVLKDYNPKKQGSPRYVPLDQPEKRTSLSAEDIFLPLEQIGITKNDKNENDEEKGFFKQTYYRFKEKEFAFSFLLELEREDNEPLIFSDTFVNLGAEGGMFRMILQESEEDELSPFFSPESLDKIILTGDAFVERPIFDSCHFALTEQKFFRNIQNETGKSDQVTRGGTRFTLLERGSVLYPRDIEAVQRHLDKANLQKIGYNKYQIIKGKRQ